MVFSFAAKEGVKKAIFAVLAEQQPLTARQVFSKIKREQVVNVSYQAVHKVLVSLKEEGVLSYFDKKYAISVEWLDFLENFSKNLKRKQSGTVLSNLPVILEFDSVAKTDAFLVDIAFKIGALVPKAEAQAYLQWCYFWVPLFLNNEIYAKIKDLLENVPTYSITCANTPVDKWCEKFWQPTFKRCKCGVKTSSNVVDFVAFGDYVIEVFYPLEIKNEIEKFFSKAKKVEDINWNDFFKKVFEKKTKIPVIILKNKTIAEELKKQTLNAFKK